MPGLGGGLQVGSAGHQYVWGGQGLQAGSAAHGGVLALTAAPQLQKECPLAQLMDCETDMVKQIRALDSDMQTLVYENYNKFISATGTVPGVRAPGPPQLGTSQVSELPALSPPPAQTPSAR